MNTEKLKRIAAIDDRRAEIKQEDDELKKERKQLEESIINALFDDPDLFSSDGHWSTSIGDKTLYYQSQLWASAQNKDAAAMGLIAAGAIDLLEPNHINSQRLSAWVRELPTDLDGNPVLPGVLKDAIKVSKTQNIRSRKR